MSALAWRELGASGLGAIRVLELSGAGARAAVERLLPGRPLAPGFTLAVLRDESGNALDEAVLRVHSDARIELQLHGSPAVVERVLAALGPPPRAAGGDSLEERALERLANATTEPAARMLLDQAEGALRRALVGLLALPAAQREPAARALAAHGPVAQALAHPTRVVLTGPVNAGKSTLFNALVGHERVLVDGQPGTTRDAVVERVTFGAYPVELVDTAGWRALPGASAAEEVERGGQALARELVAGASLVLALVPPGLCPDPAPARTLLLASRSDEGGAASGLPRLSAREDPQAARATVVQVFHAALGLPEQPWQSGRAMPFEPEWTRWLAEASGAELVHALELLLAAR